MSGPLFDIAWPRAAVTAALMVAAAVGGYAYRSHEVETDVPDGIVRIEGTIQAPISTVRSRIAGRLAEVLVAPGDTVSAGQVVARLDGRVLQAKLQAARVQLALQRQDRAVIAADIARLESEKILAGAQFELTELHVRAGRAAAEDLERDRQRMQETAAAADAARNRMARIDVGVETLETETATLEASVDGANITADETGTITAILGGIGSLIEPGDPLVEIRDTDRLFIRLPASLAGRSPSPDGVAGRVLVGGAEGRIVAATVGPAPSDSDTTGPLALLLMLDGNEPKPEGAAVGYIRILPDSRWPAAVR